MPEAAVIGRGVGREKEIEECETDHAGSESGNRRIGNGERTRNRGLSFRAEARGSFRAEARSAAGVIPSGASKRRSRGIAIVPIEGFCSRSPFPVPVFITNHRDPVTSTFRTSSMPLLTHVRVCHVPVRRPSVPARRGWVAGQRTFVVPSGRRRYPRVDQPRRCGN
jgi:hypothetical protein